MLFWYFLIRGKWFYAGITAGIAYVYFMGYMKFYRRYTLEGMMSIATDPKFRDSKKQLEGNYKKQ